MNNAPPPNTLQLSREEMRTLGYQVIDLLVEHFDTLPDKPVTRRGERPTLERQLRTPLPPEQSTPAADVLQTLQHAVFDNIMHLDHPRFFAFVPSPGNFVSVMADALVSGFNVFAGTWLESSGPATIELTTIDWLRQLCGMPDTAGGLFVSGGSVANLTALAVARHIKLGGHNPQATLYYSDQTHSSIERGLHIMGFAPQQLRKLPTAADFRLPLAALRAAVAEDRAAGRVPFCVVANAGTTNTGAVDPLPALADFCQAEGLWLHVDGAYGAAAVLSEQGRALLAGLGRADSLVIDPHKWLFQPYEIGCVLVRDSHWMRDTFHILPEYLRDIERGAEEINYCDYGIQLTRNFRALKLWMSLKVFGLAAFRQAITTGFSLAEHAGQAIQQHRDWQLVTAAQMGIVTFRYAPPRRSAAETDALNRRLVDKLIEDRFALITSTELRGQTVLRMCTINPRTTPHDIDETLRRLAAFAEQLNAAP